MLIACELEEQLKGVGVTLASVMASTTLQGKAFRKKAVI